MEERARTRNIHIEGAKIIYKNFQGKKGDYNKDGERNFGVLLSDEEAFMYERDGWNVKYRKPKEDDPEQYRQPWLPVKVKFGQYPPIAVLVTSGGKIDLDEETIGQLDWTIIKNCDLIIRPYNYPATATHEAGISAYLKAIYVTKDEDQFAKKYADIPYLNQNGQEEPGPAED